MKVSGLLLLITLVLIEGFVTVSVEVLTIRQLIPFVGNNVVVTSLIIGFFLLFLALGYQRGGYQLGDSQAILRRNFLLAAALLGIGLCYPVIQFLFSFLTRLGFNELWVLAIYLLLITSPLVYLLGQTVPIAAHLFPGDQVGAISGRVLFISTIGSFLGSVMTTLLLMNWLGVGFTIFVDFVLLAGLILLVSTHFHGTLVILIVLMGVTYSLNVGYNRSAFIADNKYGNYLVVERKTGGLDLLVNNSYSSYLGPNGENFWYIETIRRILFDEAEFRDRDILVLGAGGFTLSQPDDDNRFTYVDIDEAIKDIVAHHFNPAIQGQFIAADARTFVMGQGPKYDAIVSDAYLNRISIPDYLLTVEHFRNLAGRLKKGGIAVFNFIINPFMSDDYSLRVDNTLRAVFNHCMAVPRFYRNAATNVVYACRNPTDNPDRSVYTDDLNAAGLDITSLQ